MLDNLLDLDKQHLQMLDNEFQQAEIIEKQLNKLQKGSQQLNKMIAKSKKQFENMHTQINQKFSEIDDIAYGLVQYLRLNNFQTLDMKWPNSIDLNIEIKDDAEVYLKTFKYCNKQEKGLQKLDFPPLSETITIESMALKISQTMYEQFKKELSDNIQEISQIQNERARKLSFILLINDKQTELEEIDQQIVWEALQQYTKYYFREMFNCEIDCSEVKPDFLLNGTIDRINLNTNFSVFIQEISECRKQQKKLENTYKQLLDRIQKKLSGRKYQNQFEISQDSIFSYTLILNDQQIIINNFQLQKIQNSISKLIFIPQVLFEIVKNHQEIFSIVYYYLEFVNTNLQILDFQALEEIINQFQEREENQQIYEESKEFIRQTSESDINQKGYQFQFQEEDKSMIQEDQKYNIVQEEQPLLQTFSVNHRKNKLQNVWDENKDKEYSIDIESSNQSYGSLDDEDGKQSQRNNRKKYIKIIINALVVSGVILCIYLIYRFRLKSGSSGYTKIYLSLNEIFKKWQVI